MPADLMKNRGLADRELENIRKEKTKRLLEINEGGNEMGTIIEADAGSFHSLVIERSKKVPIVVDFWAQWCAPCLILGPILEKLAAEYGGKFMLVKVDLSGNQQLAVDYGITGIPAVKMFRDGRVVDGFVGALPEPYVQAFIDRNLDG